MAAATGAGAGNGLAAAVGLETMDAALASFYGYTTTLFEFAYTSISLGSCTGVGATGFNCDVQNADITNTAVPVPAAAWLFGSALVGLGLVRRRQS